MPYKDVAKNRAATKAWKKRNPEKVRTQNKAYREKNKNERLVYDKIYREKNRDKIEAHRLKTMYGLNVENYNELFIKQCGRCAICGKHQAELKQALSIDHCHKTGKIRGLLCAKCNLGISNLGEDIENLRCAILYLNNQITSDISEP